MSIFYDEMAAVAAEVLAEFGATSTHTRVVLGTYDPTTGTTSADTTTNTTCTLAVFPIGDKLIDGTRIQTGDQLAYLSAIGLGDPLPGDKVLWRSETYTVVKGDILAPDGTAVLYTLIIRK